MKVITNEINICNRTMQILMGQKQICSNFDFDTGKCKLGGNCETLTYELVHEKRKDAGK